MLVGIMSVLLVKGIKPVTPPPPFLSPLTIQLTLYLQKKLVAISSLCWQVLIASRFSFFFLLQHA